MAREGGGLKSTESRELIQTHEKEANVFQRFSSRNNYEGKQAIYS